MQTLTSKEGFHKASGIVLSKWGLWWHCFLKENRAQGFFHLSWSWRRKAEREKTVIEDVSALLNVLKCLPVGSVIAHLMLFCLWPALYCLLSSLPSSFSSSCIFVSLQICSFTQPSPSFSPIYSPSPPPDYFGSLPPQCIRSRPRLCTLWQARVTLLCLCMCSADKENTDAQVLSKEIRFGDFFTYRAKSVMLLMVDSAMAVRALCV